MVIQSTQTKRAWAKDGKARAQQHVQPKAALDNKQKSLQRQAPSPKATKAYEVVRTGPHANAEISDASVAQRLAAVLRAEGLQPCLETAGRCEGITKEGQETVLPCAWGHSFGALPAPPEVPPPLPRKVLTQYQHGLAAAYQREHGGELPHKAAELPPRIIESVVAGGVREEPVTMLLAKQQDSTLILRAFQAWAGFRLQGALQMQQDRAETLQTKAASQEDNLVAMEKMVAKLWKQEAGVLKSSCISACRDVASSFMDEVKQTREEFRQQMSRAEAGAQHSSMHSAREAAQGQATPAPDEWVERALLEARIECERLHLAQIERERLEQERSEKERSKCAEAVRVAQQERAARQRVQQLLDQEKQKARAHQEELARQSERQRLDAERERYQQLHHQDHYRAEHAARDLASEVLVAAKHSAAEEARRCVESRTAEFEQRQYKQDLVDEIAKKAKLDQEELQRELALEQHRRAEIEQLHLQHGLAAEEILQKAKLDQEQMQRELALERQRRMEIEEQQRQLKEEASAEQAKLDQEEREKELREERERRAKIERQQDALAEEIFQKAQLDQADMQRQLDQERQRRAEVAKLHQKYGEVAEDLKKARLDKEDMQRELIAERQRRVGTEEQQQQQLQRRALAEHSQAQIQRELLQERQRIREDEERLRLRQRNIEAQQQRQRSDLAARELTSEVVAAARQSATEEARRCVASRSNVSPSKDNPQRMNSNLTQAAEDLTAKVISAAQVAARQESIRWMRTSSTPEVATVAVATGEASATGAANTDLDLLLSSLDTGGSFGLAPAPAGMEAHAQAAEPAVQGLPQRPALSSFSARGASLPTPASLGDLYSGCWPLYSTLQASQGSGSASWQQRLNRDLINRDHKDAERKQQLQHRDRVMQEREQERRQLAQSNKTKSEQEDRVQRARSRRKEMLNERADKVRGVRERLEEQHARLEQINNERIENMMAAAKEQRSREPSSARLACGRAQKTGVRQGALSHVSDRLFSIIDSDKDGEITREELAVAFAGDLTLAEQALSMEASSWFGWSTWDVSIDKEDDQRLGVEYLLEDASILVEAIHPGGRVAHWNLMHPDLQVMVGDRIVAVNGRSGDAESLLESMRVSRQLTLTVEGNRTELELMLPTSDEEENGEVTPSWPIHDAAGTSPPHAGTELYNACSRSPQSQQQWQLHSEGPAEASGQLEEFSLHPSAAAGGHRQSPEGRAREVIEPQELSNRLDSQLPHQHQAQRLSSDAGSPTLTGPGPPPLIVAPQLVQKVGLPSALASEGNEATRATATAAPCENAKRDLNFSWPKWALDPDGAVEVYVEADGGASRWVAGAPTSRVLDEDDNDALLTVRYLWEDGDVYEEDFPPAFVRPCH